MTSARRGEDDDLMVRALFLATLFFVSSQIVHYTQRYKGLMLGGFLVMMAGFWCASRMMRTWPRM